MAYTQADLDAIKSAIASGVKEVTFEQGTVIYQSTSDMILAKSEIEDELSTSNGRTVIRRYRPVSYKGW